MNENARNTTSHHLVSAAALAVAALASQNAHAFDYKLSGHVNRMVTQADDGTQTRLFNADNINSQTRLRFTGQQEFAPGLKAGINWEVGYSSNPSSSLSMTTRSVSASFIERHGEAFLQSEWGKLSLGQGDGAANGGTEIDLSGTTVIQYSGVTDVGGKFNFRNAGGLGPTIDATIGNLDFESRYDRLRYDSPAFGPLRFSASFGDKDNNDVYELASLLNTDLSGGHKLAAALGWSRERKIGVAGDEETIGGSVSFLMRNGVSLTAAASESENDDPAATKKKFGYLKAGYKTGKHAFSVDYGRGEDFAVLDDSSKAYGIGYVYTAQSWLELYAGLKQHELNRVAQTFDDVRFVSAGLRLKF